MRHGGAALSVRASKGNAVQPSTNLLNRRELAVRLGISQRTADKIAARGDIPRLRIGRRVLFAPLDIDRYIQRLDRNAKRECANLRGQAGTAGGDE